MQILNLTTTAEMLALASKQLLQKWEGRRGDGQTDDGDGSRTELKLRRRITQKCEERTSGGSFNRFLLLLFFFSGKKSLSYFTKDVRLLTVVQLPSAHAD